MAETDGSLSGAGNPRPLAQENFSLTQWDEYRDSGIAPLHVSELSAIEAGRAEYLAGVEALGRKHILPQSLTLVDVLNAGNETNAVCIPRRASKTTTTLDLIVGRMLNPERGPYMVAFTAQTGDKARKRLIADLINPLRRKYDREDPDSPFMWGVSNSNTYVEVRATGSRITAVSPSEDAARGDAYSAFVVDESQEVAQADWDSLASAVYPTFDTVPGGGQVIALGTAGAQRSGMLWSLLEQGRSGAIAICEYAAPDGVELYDPEDADAPTEGTTADPAVWLISHPGIGNLTSIDTVRNRFQQLTPEKFARDYLGIWPNGAGSRLLPVDAWDACRIDGALPELPEQWVLAISVDNDDARGSICAVWRDADGLAHIGVLDSRPGSKWMEPVLRAMYSKHRKPVVWDGIESNAKNVVDALNAGGRVRVNVQRFPQVASAAQLMVREVKGRRVRHYGQPVLDMAVQHAIKRPSAERWLFQTDDRGNAECNITALQAAAMALRVWDEKPPTKKRYLGAVAA